MSNLCIDLDPSGTPSDTSAMDLVKTFTVDSAFTGTVIIEAKCGPLWVPIPTLRFQNPGSKTIEGVFEEVRVVGGASGSPSVSVSAEENAGVFVELPAGGASVDTSALGSKNTVIVVGLVTNDTLKCQMSDDNVNWTESCSFQNDGMIQCDIVACFMRVVYSGMGSPSICVGAAAEAVTEAEILTLRTAVELNPSAAAADLSDVLFNDFNKLMNSVEANPLSGEKCVIINCRDDITVTLPPRTAGGRYPFRDNKMFIVPTAKPTFGAFPDVVFSDGCIFEEMSEISAKGEAGVIENANMTDSPIQLLPGVDGGPTVIFNQVQLQQSALAAVDFIEVVGPSASRWNVALAINPNGNVISGVIGMKNAGVPHFPTLEFGAFLPGTLNTVAGAPLVPFIVGLLAGHDMSAAAQPLHLGPSIAPTVNGQGAWNSQAVDFAASPVSGTSLGGATSDNLFGASIEADATGGVIVINLDPADKAWGRVLRVQAKVALNSVNITPQPGDSINGAGAGVPYVLSLTAGEFVELLADGGTNYVIVNHGVP